MDEVVSGGFCTRVGAKCGRWNPTAEQVKVLTDLFTSGLRTPTTEQIQKISSLLGAFGKIESKNVFYWFQNHKARERHHKKRRRGNSGNGTAAAAAAGDDDVLVVAGGNRKEAKNCREVEQEVVWELRDREIETLELFPLSTYDGEKVRPVRNEWREISFADIAGRDPPLDLRLSFL